MFATPSETPACPDTERQHRLAAQLADMIPGAATIRVSLNDPDHTWPPIHAVAKDGSGKTIELGRTTARTAGRWIMRAWPNADWEQPHTFDLTSVTLSPTDRGQ